MATSTVPSSNVAGNNQTSPGVSSTQPVPIVAQPVSPTATVTQNAQANPFIPAATPTAATTVPSSTVGTVNTLGGANNSALSSQLDDIYGTGVGGALDTLLGNISGTNSATLQEYVQSLQPQEATAQANVNASLGAGGVSANSSVAGIADSNLQAQEFADIAGESANLTQSQENLTAQILTGTEGAAVAQTAESPWTDFADVLAAGTNAIGNIGASGLF